MAAAMTRGPARTSEEARRAFGRGTARPEAEAVEEARSGGEACERCTLTGVRGGGVGDEGKGGGWAEGRDVAEMRVFVDRRSMAMVTRRVLGVSRARTRTVPTFWSQ